MPIKSKIEQLPAELRRSLEDKLIRKDYESYQALSQWLADEGFNIHQSQIFKHAKRLRETPKPQLQQLRCELMNDGIEIMTDDAKLERLLIRLGALRLKENILMVQILNGHQKRV